MKNSSQFSEFYPDVLEIVDLESRKEAIIFWDMFSDKIEQSQNKLTDFVKYVCDSESSEDHFGLRNTLYGLNNQRWGKKNSNALLKSYIEYCSFRGTRKGIGIVFKALLPEVKVTLLENTFPGDYFLVGKSRISFNDRLVDSSVEEESLTFKFACEKSAIDADLLDQLLVLVKKEIPMGLNVYTQFESPETDSSKELTEYYEGYGEVL